MVQANVTAVGDIARFPYVFVAPGSKGLGAARVQWQQPELVANNLCSQRHLHHHQQSHLSSIFCSHNRNNKADRREENYETIGSS